MPFLNYILGIETWMAENFFQINQDKTEILVIGAEGQNYKSLSPYSLLGTWVLWVTTCDSD